MRYEIRNKVGEGGRGSVYAGWDTQLERAVAIKRLHEVGAAVPGSMGELEKEANVLASIQHPHIITLYDFGEDDEGAFVVMELIEGRTLTQIVNERPLSEADFVIFAEQVLSALVEAQSQGLLHRDLKPSNLMISNVGTSRIHTKILDFGLAKFSFKPTLQTVMVDNSVLGSVFCMAPEQFDRRLLDFRTDLYSLGCSFYYSLAGDYPFLGETMAEVMRAHMDHQTIPLSEKRPGVSRAMSDWIMRLIAFDPDDRPSNARECLLDFRALSGSAPAPELRKPLPMPQVPRLGPVRQVSSGSAVPPAVPPHLRRGRRSGRFCDPSQAFGWLLVGAAVVTTMFFCYQWVASRTSGSEEPTTPVIVEAPMESNSVEGGEQRFSEENPHGVIKDEGQLAVYATGPNRGFHAVYDHDSFTARVDADGVVFVHLKNRDGSPLTSEPAFQVTPRLKSKRKGFREPVSWESDTGPLNQPSEIEYTGLLRGESELMQNISFQGNVISFWGHCSDPLHVDEPTTAYFIESRIGPTHQVQEGTAPEAVEAILGNSRLRLRSRKAKSEELLLFSNPGETGDHGLFPFKGTSIQARLNVWKSRSVLWRMSPPGSGHLQVHLNPGEKLHDGFGIIYRKHKPAVSTRQMKLTLTIE